MLTREDLRKNFGKEIYSTFEYICYLEDYIIDLEYSLNLLKKDFNEKKI